MKRKVTFFASVSVVLLLSSVLLVGCLYAIAANNGEGKDYRGNSESGVVLEGAPTSQAEMKEKFHSYLHIENTVATVFSEQQYAELKAIREKGKRVPLTLDEVAFLVNDSISLYFTYDEIRLTNASADGILSFFPQRKTDSFLIIPYRGNFSEYKTYAEATEAYNAMLGDIFAIFYYRIYMHDAGFARIWHYNKFAEGDVAFTEKEYEQYKDLAVSERTSVYQRLILDGGQAVDSKYQEVLLAAYQNAYQLDKQILSGLPVDSVSLDEYPIVLTENLTAANPSFYFGISITPAYDGATLFPTDELRNMKPTEKTTYVADVTGFAPIPQFHLNYQTATFEAEATDEAGFYFTLCGSFEEKDDILFFSVEGFNYFKKGSSPSDLSVGYEALEKNKYFYVLHKQQNSYAYSAAESSPYVGTGPAWTDGFGFDWQDGLVFLKKISAWNDQ